VTNQNIFETGQKNDLTCNIWKTGEKLVLASGIILLFRHAALFS